MSGLLSSAAVGRRSESEASEILQAYIATGPQMSQNHTLESAPANKAPNPAGSIDPLAR
jgi:hypothetical protein